MNERICSAASIARLTDLINEYHYSTTYTVESTDTVTKKVYKGADEFKAGKVVYYNRRYFYYIDKSKI